MSLKHQIAFSRLRGLHPQVAEELLARFGSEEGFFNVSSRQLNAVFGRRLQMFDDKIRQLLLDQADSEIKFIEQSGVSPLYFHSEQFPERLERCDDSPLMLYALGDTEVLNSRIAVSIVGTRHATPYGLSFVKRLVERLAERLVEPPVIVSGLALGIDIAAHRAAMAAGLPTVAVLAHGLSTIYPAVHRAEAAKIARGGGALVTEYTSTDAVHKGNFLARNRIIAGISDCTVVVESARRGGAMATARVAREYGSDVFAVPGRIGDPYSEGCNTLIHNNVAALISSPDDLIASMGWPCRPEEPEQPALPVALSDDEQSVVDLLTRKSEARLNEISVSLNIPISKLSALMLDMEFRNLVTAYPGGLFRLA